MLQLDEAARPTAEELVTQVIKGNAAWMLR